MPPQPPLIRLDLLLVGGMTVDRFADGSTAPGGSVLHAAPAAIATGRSVGAITSAGFEPEVEAGLSRLAGLRSLEVQRVGRSIEYEHRASALGRELRFLGSAGLPISVDAVPSAAAVLLAPVAAELDAAAARQVGAPMRAAILQGWLRRLEPGEVVTALPLAALDASLRGALGGYDLLIASTEDLVAESLDVDDQLDAVRRELGAGPVLVLTEGAAGAWIDRTSAGAGPNERWLVPLPRVVGGADTIGAGDVFAALLTVGWPDVLNRASLTRATRDAMRGVAEELERRA